MKKLGILLVTLITATLVFSAIGCSSGGGGGAGGVATATPTHTVAATNTPVTTVKPGVSPAQTEAVSSDVLISFIPKPPPGWEGADAVGEKHAWGNCTLSYAWGGYRSQTSGESVRFEIHDSAYCPGDLGILGFQTLRSLEGENPRGYFRNLTVAGYPASLVYDKELYLYTYDLWVLVADRFTVRTLAKEEATINTFSSLIDYAGIAALK